MGELDSYKPYDYPRLCDVCGNRRRISAMQKMPGGVWVCDIHKDERTAVELSKLKPKSYNIIPVPDAKPESRYPDVMEAEEAVIMNFVDRMTVAGTRYEQVISGVPAPVAGNMIDGLSWSARYLYAIITDTTSPSKVVTHAKGILLSIATQLRARQQGFGLSSSSTLANDAFFGGFLESGASYWFGENAATAGLALLYAYRVFGTVSYLASARAAASFLRNLQAIGKCGTNFTSSDAAGANRLYTGAITNSVATASGFYADHSFYPSSLVALQFWKELKTTDGDQMVGSTGTPTGFTTAPTQLLSTSMTELRDFWTNGVLDAAGETYSGLSSTTPREFFNAYPAAKPNATVFGTGRWEYEDGVAATGTTVTTINFATALAALYAYEGASSQVTTIDDWMRSFTSNPSFETPDIVSARTLARSTTGDYDATLCPASLLLIRDAANSYAAISLNGSSLYDWGAFGVLSPLWSTRHGGTFPDARTSVFGKNERFDDGIRTDGDYIDWISMRGYSGLSYQTAFSVDATGRASTSLTGSSAVTSPPTVGLVFWVKGDAGVTTSGGRLSAWANQAPSSPNPGLLSAGDATSPTVATDTLNGIPGVVWESSDIFAYQYVYLASTLGVAISMKDRSGHNFGYGAGETQARTCWALVRPRWISGYDIVGGTVMRFGQTVAGGNQDFEALLNIEPTAPSATNFMLESNQFRTGPTHLCGPSGTTGGAAGTYTDKIVTIVHSSSGFSDIHAFVNGAEVPLNPSVLQAAFGGASVMQSFAFGSANQGGDLRNQWHGTIFEGGVYDHKLDSGELAQLNAYLATRSSAQAAAVSMTNDVVRSAMFGIALHQNPVAQAVPS